MFYNMFNKILQMGGGGVFVAVDINLLNIYAMML